MGEKKRRQLSGQQVPPRQEYLIDVGFRAIQSGDTNSARSAYRALLENLPEDAQMLNSIAALAMELGDPSNAEKLFRHVGTTWPDVPAYRCNLASVLHRTGRSVEALEVAKQAVALDPGLAESHVTLGNILMESDRFTEALPAFERAVALLPDHPDALYGLGSVQAATGQKQLGCQNLERAVSVDPGFHQAYANLADARMSWAAQLRSSPGTVSKADEQVVRGIECISTALRLYPANPLYWSKFSEYIKTVRIRYPLDGFARELLMRALEHPAVDAANVVNPILSLIHSHPDLIEFERLLGSPGSPNELSWREIGRQVSSVLDERLLQKAMTDTVVPDASVERLVAYARSAMLDEVLSLSEPSLPAAVIAAMAHFGFNTEYACIQFARDGTNTDLLLQRIRDRRASRASVPPHWYAIYAAFRPLRSLENARSVADEMSKSAFFEVALRQIVEPLEELELSATIPSLNCTRNTVSLAVRSQYEENPYPRWIGSAKSPASRPVAEIMRAMFPKADLNGVSNAAIRILIAGCGTGQQPIATAQRFSNASVLAIDLSTTSLAYAKRKTLQLGLGNIEYQQADILELGSIEERFDLIECSGVLHHLEDPVAGWRVLCGLLQPGGLIRIGLYSEIARRHVVRGREFIASEGFEPTPEGIRQCREAILSRPEDRQLAKLTESVDFYSLSGCRDLIFHVLEHRFTLAQIEEILDLLGLEFLGFEHPDPFLTSMVESGFETEAPLSRLEHWHRYEVDHPDTFRRMYQFWSRDRRRVAA